MPNEMAEPLSAAAAAKYLRCQRSTLIGWARRGCHFAGGAVVKLAFDVSGTRFLFTLAALDEFRAACKRAAQGEPVAALPPDPGLARGLAARERVAAKLAGPVNGSGRKPRAKAAR